MEIYEIARRMWQGFQAYPGMYDCYNPSEAVRIRTFRRCHVDNEFTKNSFGMSISVFYARRWIYHKKKLIYCFQFHLVWKIMHVRYSKIQFLPVRDAITFRQKILH